MDEATHKKNFKPINLKDLFMGKNPKAGRWIPGFVYRFLPRMLRIDFMDDPINKHEVQATNNVRRINESYKRRDKHFVMSIGKPIPFSTFDKRHTPVEWAALVKDYTYTLAENPESEFDDLNH